MDQVTPKTTTWRLIQVTLDKEHWPVSWAGWLTFAWGMDFWVYQVPVLKVFAMIQIAITVSIVWLLT